MSPITTPSPTDRRLQPVNKWSVKGDHIFNDKHRISGYYGYDREKLTPGPEGPATLPGLYTNYNDLTQYSDVFPHELGLDVERHQVQPFLCGRQQLAPEPQSAAGIHRQLEGQVLPRRTCRIATRTWSTSTSATAYPRFHGAASANNGSENTIYSFNDDFTWIKGSHTFKLGGQYQLSHYNGFGRQCISGCATFSYTETGVPGGTNPNAGGNPFASLLLGYADSGSIDTVRFIGQQWPYFAGYFQDDWRVNPKLTLNLGLRWETQLPPTGLRRPLERFLADHSESGRREHSGRADLRRRRARAASAAARWRIPIQSVWTALRVSPIR